MIAKVKLPYYVSQIIDELKLEDSTISIWLIGSRANGNAKNSSDWDLLVFSTKETCVTGRRHENVDVIIVDPTESCLLEGKTIDFKLSFKNWSWSDKGGGFATYIGQKFIDYPSGIRDSSDPRCEKSINNAYCLWGKSQVHV